MEINSVPQIVFQSFPYLRYGDDGVLGVILDVSRAPCRMSEWHSGSHCCLTASGTPVQSPGFHHYQWSFFLNFETSSILTYCLLGFLLWQERVVVLWKGSTVSKSSFLKLPSVHIEPCNFSLDYSSHVYITNLHKVIGKARAHRADVPAWAVKDRFDLIELFWFIIVTYISIQWKYCSLSAVQTMHTVHRKGESSECNVAVRARVKKKSTCAM